MGTSVSPCHADGEEERDPHDAVPEVERGRVPLGLDEEPPQRHVEVGHLRAGAYTRPLLSST